MLFCQHVSVILSAHERSVALKCSTSLTRGSGKPTMKDTDTNQPTPEQAQAVVISVLS